MNSKLKPALLGGLIVGLLSAIPLINYCCCIWGVGGGAVAAYLYIQGSPIPVKPGEGAMVGALAGVVGGLIYLVIGVPLALLISGGAAGIESQLRAAGLTVPFSGVLLMLIGGLVGAVILVGLAVAGGAIGVAMFEKRKGDAPPPPPPGM